jgi:uncharacterized protein YcfJ
VTSEKSHATKASSAARESGGVSAGSVHGSVTGEAVGIAVEGDNNAEKATEPAAGAQEGVTHEEKVSAPSVWYVDTCAVTYKSCTSVHTAQENCVLLVACPC